MARLGRAQPFKPKLANPAGIGGGSDVLFDQKGNSGDKLAQVSYTFNRTVAGNNNRYIDFAVCILGSSTTVTSVTDDNGGTNAVAVLIGGANTAGSTMRVEWWRVIAPVVGTKQVSVVLSGSVESITLWGSYYNVHQTIPTESFSSHQDSSSPASDAVIPVADRCWARWAIAVNKTSTVTSGNTPRNSVTGSAGSALDSDTNGVITPAGSTSGSWTYTGLPGLSVVAGYALRPAFAVSSSGSRLLLSRRRKMGAY